MRRFFILIALLAVHCQAGWLPGWRYRSQLTVTNSQVGALVYYPVPLSLAAGNFAFSQVLSDCSDIRVTDTDGTTIIPYTITSCNVAGQTAEIWIQPASVPGSGTYQPYLYWGNSTPTLFDVPPLGPFTPDVGNPTLSSGSVTYYANNSVFDVGTSKYWMFDNVGLAYSTDLITWTHNGAVTITGSSGTRVGENLVLSGGTWYVFYGTSADNNIYYATASTVTGPYTQNGSASLSTGAGWESSRVIEPRLIQVGSTWYMFYVGDSGGNTEQIGYATASAITGPWTKYGSNPVLAFGATGSFDAGTIADPWVYKLGSTYYIGYACSSTNGAWNMCIATSVDLITFFRTGIKLWREVSGWDSAAVWRGAVARIADTYYLTYGGQGGANPAVGTATQSAKSTAVGYPPQQIFQFFDDFTAFDLSVWRFVTGKTAGTASASGSILTVTSGVSGQEEFLSSNTSPPIFTFNIGQNAEWSLQRTANTANVAIMAGFNDSTGSIPGNRNGIFDNSTASGFWQLACPGKTSSSSSHVDTSSHVQSIWFKSATETDYKVDAAAAWEANTTCTSTATYRPLMIWAFAQSGANATGLYDWVRVRQYTGADPVTTLGVTQSSANSLFFFIP